MPLSCDQPASDLFGVVSSPQATRSSRRARRVPGKAGELEDFRQLLAARFATLMSSTEDAVEHLRDLLACVDCGDDVSQIDHAVECLDDDLTDALREFRRELALW